MNALIVGYGRMGREIETILLHRGHKIVARVDKTSGVGDASALSPDLLKASDVAIEFSLPEGVLENVRQYAQAGLPAVIGTTGWFDQLPQIRTLVEDQGSSLVYGSNYSLGAHMFFALAAKAASMIALVPDYDIFVTETHHRMKKDSPSGTALSVAQRIIEANPRKSIIQTEKLDRAIRDEELHVASVRGGTVPGIHSVFLESEADMIEIQHSARTRQGFALGAVLAAEWIRDKKGLHPVEEFMKDFLKG